MATYHHRIAAYLWLYRSRSDRLLLLLFDLCRVGVESEDVVAGKMTAGITTGGVVEVMKKDADDPEVENMEDTDKLDVAHDLSEGPAIFGRDLSMGFA